MRSMLLLCMLMNGIIMHSSLDLLFIPLTFSFDVRMNTSNLYATGLWARIYSSMSDCFAFEESSIPDVFVSASRAVQRPPHTCIYIRCVHSVLVHLCMCFTYMLCRVRVRACRMLKYTVCVLRMCIQINVLAAETTVLSYELVCIESFFHDCQCVEMHGKSARACSDKPFYEPRCGTSFHKPCHRSCNVHTHSPCCCLTSTAFHS